MIWTGYLLAGGAYFLFGLHLVRQSAWTGSAGRVEVAVLSAAGFSVLWAVTVPWLQQEPSAWGWFGHACDVLRYAAWYAFMVLLLNRHGEGGEEGPTLSWLLPLALGLVLYALLSADRMSMMLLALCGLVLLEQLFRNLRDDARWSAKPVCLGLAGTFIFDVYLFSQGVLFNALDADAVLARPYVHGMMVPLLLLASTRHRNWAAKIRVSRRLAFHSASLLLAGVYLLLIAAAGYYVRYFGGDWGRVVQVALVFLAVMLLAAVALSGSLRARIRVSIGKHLFHYRYDYRDEWLKFTQALSSHQNPEDLSQCVIRGLADMVESTAGALWLLSQDGSAYRQVSRWNMSASSGREPADSEWMVFMREQGWVIDLAEYRRFPGRYRHLRLPPWMAEFPQAWLLVPLFVANDLQGFVVLASPRAALEVNWEVNDLLKTAARQAAGFLAQMQATEALLESRKFDAFNRMSAFVVHDLKNIVTQLSLMVKNAKRLRDNPEFQADMLLTVENSLERMRQMMAQLREGAAPAGAAAGVDLSGVAGELAAAAASRGRAVELDLMPDVYTRGHEERLRRVIGHLVHNALDATESHSGRVWIRSRRVGSQAQLVVADEGVGMSQDFIEHRLFKPFQSTKSAGMGIGAYESFQYVQELGGKIEVQSREGQGTQVSLLLPVMDAVKTSDLHRV